MCITVHGPNGFRYAGISRVPSRHCIEICTSSVCLRHHFASWYRCTGEKRRKKYKSLPRTRTLQRPEKSERKADKTMLVLMNFHFSARTFGDTGITILFSRKRDAEIELERRRLLLSFRESICKFIKSRAPRFSLGYILSAGFKCFINKPWRKIARWRSVLNEIKDVSDFCDMKPDTRARAAFSISVLSILVMQLVMLY